MEGIIIKNISNDYTVQVDNEIYVYKLGLNLFTSNLAQELPLK